VSLSGVPGCSNYRLPDAIPVKFLQVEPADTHFALHDAGIKRKKRNAQLEKPHESALNIVIISDTPYLRPALIKN
jgi:hypothetical protein